MTDCAKEQLTSPLQPGEGFAVTADDGTTLSCRINDDDSVCIEKCTPAGTHLVIPRMVGGLPVTRIGTRACAYASIESVSLPDTLREIDPYAFSVTKLKALELPGSIRRIGNHAFYRCTDLAHIALNEGLAVIGTYAFAEHIAAKLTIPSSVEHVEHNALFGSRLRFCLENHPVHIADGNAKYIVDDYGCLYERKDGELVLIDTIDKSIEACTPLPGTARIGEQAFSKCSKLVRVVLGDGLRVIETAAFKSCKSLTTVETPGSLEAIEDSAFEMTSLAAIALPASCTKLGAHAFVTSDGTADATTPTLRSVSVDARNERFYTQEGMLIERLDDNSKSLVICFAPHATLRIPRDVTHVCPYALNHVGPIDTLVLHDNIETIGYLGISVETPLRELAIELSQPIDGRTYISHDFSMEVDAQVPVRNLLKQGMCSAEGIMGAYDASCGHIRDAFDRSRRIAARLLDPILMDSTYEYNLTYRLRSTFDEAVREFARRNYLEGFDNLAELGYITRKNIADIIALTTELGCVEATGHLLQMQRDRMSDSRADFSL